MTEKFKNSLIFLVEFNFFYYFKKLSRRFKSLNVFKKIVFLFICIVSLKTTISLIKYLRQDLLTSALLYQNISRYQISCTGDNIFDPAAKYSLFKYFYQKESTFNTFFHNLELENNFSQFKLCKTGHFKESFKSKSVHGSSKYSSFFLNLTQSNLSTLRHIRPPFCIQELFYYLNESLQIFQSDNLPQISLKVLKLFKNKKNEIQKFLQYKQNLTVIIIPFMNREQNLVDMLHNLHPYLQRQFLNYKIVVAEQINTQDPFNKGRLYNFAYDFLKKRYNDLSCLILQDVDLVPESDYNVYECGEHPRHLSGSIRSESDTEYGKNLYELLIGGVLCIKPESFEKINGFSNEFWYWGGEDDDMVIRMLAKDMCVTRPKPEYALYKMSKHKKSKRNPNRNNLLFSSVNRMNFDGLNNLNDLNAGVVEEVEFGMYVKLKINVGSFNRSKKLEGISEKN